MYLVWPLIELYLCAVSLCSGALIAKWIKHWSGDLAVPRRSSPA